MKLLAFAFCFLLLSCNQKQSPIVKFNFTKVHLSGKSGQKFHQRFVVTNDGGSPLKIDKAEVGCDCTVVDYPKNDIEPNQSKNIDIIYNSSGSAEHINVIRKVILITNAHPKIYTLTMAVQLD